MSYIRVRYVEWDEEVRELIVPEVRENPVYYYCPIYDDDLWFDPDTVEEDFEDTDIDGCNTEYLV